MKLNLIIVIAKFRHFYDRDVIATLAYGKIPEASSSWDTPMTMGNLVLTVTTQRKAIS